MEESNSLIKTEFDKKLDKVFGTGWKGSTLMLAAIISIELILQYLLIEVQKVGKSMPVEDFLNKGDNKHLPLANQTIEFVQKMFSTQ